MVTVFPAVTMTAGTADAFSGGGINAGTGFLEFPVFFYEHLDRDGGDGQGDQSDGEKDDFQHNPVVIYCVKPVTKVGFCDQ